MSNFIKTTGFAVLAGISILLVSCELFSTTEAADSGTFNLGAISGKMKLGDTVKVSVTLEATAAPTSFNYLFVKGTDTIPADSFLFVKTQAPGSERSISYDLGNSENVRIVTTSNLLKQKCGGTYTLVIQAGLDGKLMATGKVDFEVMGPTCDASGNVEVDLEEASVVGAAQLVTNTGSAIDFNAAVSYQVGDANTNAAKVDLFVVGKTGTEAPFLVSKDTVEAYINTYNLANFNTSTYYLASVGDDFSKITNQGLVDLLWDESKASSKQELILAVGNTYLVKTNDGVVLTKVTKVEGSDKTSLVTFSVLKAK